MILALSALSALATTAAGCFTSPINRAPVVTELDYDRLPLRGQPVTFTARGYDPDQDPLTWTWAVTAPPCPDPGDPAGWPAGSPSPLPAPTMFTVAPSSTGAPVCVWAFATDPYGAVGANNQALVPTDNPPQAVISVLSPAPASSYPDYSSFRLSAADSTDADADPLMYVWKTLQPPIGSTAALGTCGGASATDDSSRCFDADLPGQYVVPLDVTDGTQTTSTSLTLTVLPDHPPCITMTTPPYGVDRKDDPTNPMPIQVNMVADDGDPYPGTPGKTATFTWFKRKNGTGTWQYVPNANFFMLNLVSTDYQVGDVANVRVEVHDRNPAAVDAILLDCGDQPLCSVPGDPTCYVRVSWNIEMDL